MIELVNIKKKFDNNIILDNFNATIEDNEIVAIAGTSGSGKTTLLNILGLLDVEYEGNVVFNGVSFRGKKYKGRNTFIRNNINYLFQNYALIDDQSVVDNLMYAMYYTKYSSKEKNDLIAQTLDEVGLKGMEKKKIYKLSGGEQQRVALARLILKPGNIILADEPTGNLDQTNKIVVLDILHKLNRAGKAVIIVTHDDEIAASCNRIIKL